MIFCRWRQEKQRQLDYFSQLHLCCGSKQGKHNNQPSFQDWIRNPKLQEPARQYTQPNTHLTSESLHGVSDKCTPSPPSLLNKVPNAGRYTNKHAHADKLERTNRLPWRLVCRPERTYQLAWSLHPHDSVGQTQNQRSSPAKKAQKKDKQEKGRSDTEWTEHASRNATLKCAGHYAANPTDFQLWSLCNKPNWLPTLVPMHQTQLTPNSVWHTCTFPSLHCKLIQTSLNQGCKITCRKFKLLHHAHDAHTSC